MYMNNGPGMWITIQSFLIYKDIVVYAQWLGYYQSLARLRVTGSVTRVILPHLWLLIGTPLVKTLWMWIKANLDFWHLLFFWNQPRPLIYFTGPSWFKKQQPKNKTKKTKKKKKKKNKRRCCHQRVSHHLPIHHFGNFCYHNNHTTINFIHVTMIWFLNSKLGLNLSWAKDFGTWFLWWLGV